MCKKATLRVNLVGVSLLVFTFAVHSDSYFSAISHLKDKMDGPPCIIMTPQGGYFAFWQERVTKIDYVDGAKRTLSYYPNFYSYVNLNGDLILDRREIDLQPRIYYRQGIAITPNSSIWLDKNKLMLIGWRMYGITDPSVYRPIRLIMNSSGEVISGPDTYNQASGNPDVTLVQDSKGNVYAISVGLGVWVSQVYPTFHAVTHTSHDDLQKMLQHDTEYLEFSTLWDAVVTITDDDKLLVCSRVGWGRMPYADRGAWEKYRSDKVYYFFVDLEGNYISDPALVELEEYAFRKAKGIHLGGLYYAPHRIKNLDEAEAVEKDMDLSTLMDGFIIFSVTGEDDNGELCLYQLKFAPDGTIEKPNQTLTITPRPFPKDKVLPVSKVVCAQSMDTHLVLFGFDEEGNFYSERIMWRENRD
jgi:hypothetical protein